MVLSGDTRALWKLLPASLVLLFLTSLIYVGGWHKTLFERAAPPHRHSSHHTQLKCATPYNKVLGFASGIPAFSNCHHSYTSGERAYVTLVSPQDIRKEPFYIGQQRQISSGRCWNAAEYINRFFYFMRGILFAYDDLGTREFWSTIEFHGNDGLKRRYETVELPNSLEVNTANERKRLAPRFADVVVWRSDPEGFLPMGHVAVVVHVEDDVQTAGGVAQLRKMQKEQVQPLLVYIAEQNFDNKYWEGKNYSRVLRFSWKNGKEMLLQDPDNYDIIGRVRAGKLKYNEIDNEDL